MKAVNFHPLSPIFFLQRSAMVYPDTTCIVEKNNTKTYLQFYNECLELARRFTKIGIHHSDKIAYICNNNCNFLMAFYAVPFCGAVVVPINFRLNESLTSYILQHSEAKVLVIEEEYFCPSYANFVEKVLVISKNDSTYKYDKDNIELFSNFMSLAIQDIPPFQYDDIDECDLISINYTSGTTGSPKGAMYTHRSTYLNAMGECLQTGLTNKSKYLWTLPLFHCNGWCFSWAVTAVGGTHVFIDTRKPEDIIEAILSYKITHLCAAPTVLTKLLNSPNFNQLNNCKDLTVVTAGASPSRKLITMYEKIGINIIHVYGLTETHGPHSICERKPHWDTVDGEVLSNEISCQGIVGIHSLYMRVVDKNMNDVPHDGTTMGEIVMRGNNVMGGYYKDKEATENAFQGGWFHSGDVAVVRSNGYIEVKDRLKDIIISGGENIPSILIENHLKEHPSVLEAAIIPKTDELWGEVPLAIIELNDNFTITEKELIDFCRAKLPHYMCPKEVVFRTLPKTSTGKIQKNILKEEYNNINISSTARIDIRDKYLIYH